MSRVIVPCVLELGSVIDNHLHCACSTDLQVARDIVKEKAAAQSFQAKAEVRVNRWTSVTVRAPERASLCSLTSVCRATDIIVPEAVVLAASAAAPARDAGGAVVSVATDHECA